MCGIAGYLAADRSYEVPAGLLDRMVDVIAHRGPDDRGVYRERNVAIGMRRLSIIDTAGGHQPMTNEDGTLQVVFNGEIYNYPDLRRQLSGSGHAFRTHSDTEVLVHGYEQWGIDGLVERLNGIFAFCLWDRRERTAYMVRDQIGVKPLYFIHRNDRFAFGSELKCLIHSGLVSAHVDEIALWSYLRYQFSAGPRTLLAGVQELPAGHFLRWRDGQVQTHRYWDYPDAVECRRQHTDREESTQRLRDLMSRVVKEQMISDVPVGCFLSGGLDSTIIACLMARHSTGPVRTFSIGFPGDREHDETDFAEFVAKEIGSRHETIPFDEKSVLRLIESDFAWWSDEPVADPAMLPTYLLSQRAAQEVKVVLTGEGADEVFAGYTYYRSKVPAYAPNGLMHGIRQGANLLSSTTHALELAKRHGRFSFFPDQDGRSPHSGFPYAMKDDFLWALLHPDRRPDYGRMGRYLAGIEDGIASRLSSPTDLQKAQYLDSRLWLVDNLMPKLDKMTMAHSLEGRVPFLSPELVGFAFGIPDEWKVGPEHGKEILRDAMRGIIPDSMWGRVKHGFNVPLARWFQGELKELVRDTLLGATVRQMGVFDPVALRVLADCNGRLRLPIARCIWVVLLLTQWYARVRREVAEANRALRDLGACLVPPPEPARPAAHDAAARDGEPLPPTDIVIPIYEGAYLVRDLLRSIDCYTDAAVTPYHVWLVDDGSDPNTFERLQAMAGERPRVTLVRNERNLGFVQTANRGMFSGQSPFVVLLNSDTMVAPGWLERMIRCAQSDDKIALVNPLSNRSVNLSVEMMPGLNLETMAARVAEETPTYPDIVTVVGFCMLVKRKYLDWLGAFDPIFGMGYCEESDLHMRFVKAGLRAVLADDAFVYHKGCGSFGTWLERYQINRKIFDSRWDEDYWQDWRCFERRDSIERIRRQLLEYTVPLRDYSEELLDTIDEIADPAESDTTLPVADYPVSAEKWNRYVDWRRARDGRRMDNCDAREVSVPTAAYVRRLPKTNGLRITFLVYGLEMAGGVLSIVQLAREFMLAGHDVKLVTTCHHEQMLWPEKVHLPCQPLIFANDRRLVRDFPESDIVIPTYWETAYRYLPELRERHDFASVYFVQDYEAWFFPEGDPQRRQVVESLGMTDVRVVKSQWLADLLAAHGHDAAKIHLGLDLDIFYPRSGRRPERPRVLACARITEPRRGLLHLLSVYEQLYQLRPDLELCFYGCSDEELERLNLAFPYKNYGRIYDLNRVARVLSECHIAFDSSLYQALGRPGLEAMACGTAAVLPNIGGIHEYASDGRNCLLVSPGDSRGAVEAILRLAEDTALRESLTRQGIEVAKQFCHRDEARQHLDLYQRLLARQRWVRKLQPAGLSKSA